MKWGSWGSGGQHQHVSGRKVKQAGRRKGAAVPTDQSLILRFLQKKTAAFGECLGENENNKRYGVGGPKRKRDEKMGGPTESFKNPRRE